MHSIYTSELLTTTNINEFLNSFLGLAIGIFSMNGKLLYDLRVDYLIKYSFKKPLVTHDSFTGTI